MIFVIKHMVTNFLLKIIYVQILIISFRKICVDLAQLYNNFIELNIDVLTAWVYLDPDILFWSVTRDAETIYWIGQNDIVAEWVIRLQFCLKMGTKSRFIWGSIPMRMPRFKKNPSLFLKGWVYYCIMKHGWNDCTTYGHI